jgi:hypothetical protein
LSHKGYLRPVSANVMQQPNVYPSFVTLGDGDPPTLDEMVIPAI